MNEQLTWVDLCSGLGGASQPALDRGWRVIRIDIDARFKPDIVADVRHLPLQPFHVDVLWASPPCQEFSKHGLRCFYPNPPEPDLSIALGVKAEIERLAPRWWVVENVWASRPWLSRIFGQVRAKPPGHALWSNLLLMLPNIAPHKSGNDRHLGGSWHGKPPAQWRSVIKNMSHAPSEAARIPYEIGEAICAAVERRSIELALRSVADGEVAAAGSALGRVVVPANGKC